jgi:hypothetical protein
LFVCNRLTYTHVGGWSRYDGATDQVVYVTIPKVDGTYGLSMGGARTESDIAEHGPGIFISNVVPGTEGARIASKYVESISFERRVGVRLILLGVLEVNVAMYPGRFTHTAGCVSRYIGWQILTVNQTDVSMGCLTIHLKNILAKTGDTPILVGLQANPKLLVM